jgi:peptide/nickel transport system substrate-binding protein
MSAKHTTSCIPRPTRQASRVSRPLLCIQDKVWRIAYYVSRITPGVPRLAHHARRLTLQATLLFALLLTACSQTSNPVPPPTPQPLPGSLKTAIIPLPEDPPGFNAYLSDTGYEEVLGELVYEGLAEMAPDGSFYPKLALELPSYENGDISPDGLIVTWKLRDHIRWSDGVPFTSDDVRFTWEALSHPDNGLAGVTGFDLIDRVETPDDYTAVVYYRQPYANMLGQFGGRGLGIFPRHACGDPGRMVYWSCNTQPVGTGPFVLQKWEEGKELVFDRNPYYWQTDRPLLDRLVFPIVPREQVRSDMLMDGDAHLNLWLTPDQIQDLQDAEGVHLISTPNRWLLRLVFNLSQPPDEEQEEGSQPNAPQPHFALGDPRVREALDLAIDRERLIQEAFEGAAQPAYSEFYRGWATCPDVTTGPARLVPYNPDAARALLAQAGWFDLNGDGVLEAHGSPYAPDETKLQLSLLTYDNWDQINEAQKLIADMLREVGIRVTTDVAAPGDLWGDWQDGGLEVHSQFDADLWDDGYPGIDPTDYLIWRYASWSIPSMKDGGAGGNVMHFADPAVDRLLLQAQAESDPHIRRQIYCQIERSLADQRPMLYLVYFSDTYAYSSHLQGLILNPNDTLTWNVINWQVE